MTLPSMHHAADEPGPVMAAMRGTDQTAFAALAERYRPELHVHCYRMLGSLDDAEDQVQETLLRAWRNRGSYAGRSTFRAWLYRIATNACLVAIEASGRRVDGDAAAPMPEARVWWLQPYPDRLLESIASSDDEPDAVVVAKETIELAFVAATQHLPPRQRAALILRDVLGWRASEVADLLDGSVASVNSAVQRARETLREKLPRERTEWARASEASEVERELVARFAAAHEGPDMAAFASMLREDATHTMPLPGAPDYLVGRDAIVAAWGSVMAGSSAWGEFRVVATRANGRPALANYLRRPGRSQFEPLALDVLGIEDGLIAEVVSFPASIFPAFGLPPGL